MSKQSTGSRENNFSKLNVDWRSSRNKKLLHKLKMKKHQLKKKKMKLCWR
jgi:hypothetical protein